MGINPQVFSPFACRIRHVDTYVMNFTTLDIVVFASYVILTRTTRNMPESAYLLDQMIRYVAAGDFAPDGSIDLAFFKGWSGIIFQND